MLTSKLVIIFGAYMHTTLVVAMLWCAGATVHYLLLVNGKTSLCDIVFDIENCELLTVHKSPHYVLSNGNE